MKLSQKFARRHQPLSRCVRNPNYRTNNALIENFQVNTLNELTASTNGGTLTVVGTTTSQATNVAVNGTNAASNYNDATFAAPNMPLTTTYTAVASDGYGRRATNTVTVNIATNTTYQYDGNGNLIYDGVRNFAYDDENQLIQVWVTNQWLSQFAYDGKMRRRIRQECAWQGGAWVRTNQVYYVYDGNEVIQERDINNLPTTTYTRGKDLSGSLGGGGGIGGLLSMTLNTQPGPSSSNSMFYHSDGNGNVTMLINGYQAIVAKYLYDAFGNVISKSGLLADANLYLFSSKEAHPNSGLVYYLYRYYDPHLQRWLNRDPIDEAGGINLYGFVGNSPVNRIDPYGLVWYNPWSWGIWNSIANQFYPTPAIAPTPAPANPLVDPDDAALDRALANGATPGSAFPGAGQQAADATKQMLADTGKDLAQAAMMAIPGGAEEEELLAAARAAKAAKCEKVANAISKGHAYAKHVLGEGQFNGATTSEFADIIQSVMENPSAERALSNGRTAYYDANSGLVVIVNPNASDFGTAFVPANPLQYFNGLK